jgi:DNA-directed RNA polymerase sigma subunit (sigma70/sigma32)
VLPVSASWGTVHKYSEIAHASRELWRQLQRQPFDEEIAAEAGCGVATVLAFREAFGARPVSPETVTEGGEVQEILTDPRPSQEEVLQLKELQADVARVVEQLTPVQRECIVLRFGLDGNEAHGVGWIAAHRGVCRNSVHVAIRLATKALQDALREWDAA